MIRTDIDPRQRGVDESLQDAGQALKSLPAGRFVHFGPNGEYSVEVRKQIGEEDCIPAGLETLGYDTSGLVPNGEGQYTSDHISQLTGTELLILDLPTQFEEPHLVAGIRKESGATHFFVRWEDAVIDPYLGKAFPAAQYLQQEITEVVAAIPVPFKGVPRV